MRNRWIVWERWLREHVRGTMWHTLRRWAQRTGTTAKQVRRITPRRTAPPVATLVGDVLQVDPVQAVQWHRAWMTYLHAKALEVAQRQAVHAAWAEGEAP